MEKVVLNKLLDKLIDNSTRSNTFKPFDTAYLITSENINGYMHNLTGQDILTVCSSGDHFLSALLEGADNIDLFDINAFTYVTLNLKIAAVKALEYEEFLTYYGIINRNYTLDYNLYLKVREFLDDEFKYIFDYLYMNSGNDGLYMINKTSVFYKDTNPDYIMLNNCCYLNKDNYYILKDYLKSTDIPLNFMKSNVFDLPGKLTKKYDAIFLSNISDYNKSEKIIELANELKEYLNDNGILYFAYLYNSTYNNFYPTTYKEYVDSHPECYKFEVPSVYRYRVEKENQNQITDKVFALRKY